MHQTLKDHLMEADRQAEQEGLVWTTLRGIARRFEALSVPYAVVGGIALQHHGVHRSTQDLDVLVEPADLIRIHEVLIGHGYDRKSPESRHLRDEVTRIRVEFLVTGEFPGDGRPKPVAFPSPATASERSDEGIHFVDLRNLIEMKLASAKSAPQRIKDRSDVLELIHARGLTPEFAANLNAYVRTEYLELVALPPPSQPS